MSDEEKKRKAMRAALKGFSKTKTGKNVQKKVEKKAKQTEKWMKKSTAGKMSLAALGVAKVVHDKKVDVNKDFGGGFSASARISEDPRIQAKYKKKLGDGRGKVEIEGSATRGERRISGKWSKKF